jgi:hypothetical protein
MSETKTSVKILLSILIFYTFAPTTSHGQLFRRRLNAQRQQQAQVQPQQQDEQLRATQVSKLTFK